MINCRDTGEVVDNYKAYLKTKHWKDLRLSLVAERGYKCSIPNCDSGLPIQAHHTTYERVGNESPEDLTLLCRRCHSAEHKRLEIEAFILKEQQSKAGKVWFENEKPNILRIIRNTNHPNNLLNNIKQAFHGEKLNIILASEWFRDLEARKRKSCGVSS
jgi:hypothetical protein